MDDWNRKQPYDPWTQAMGPMAPMFAPWMQMMRLWTDGMSAMAPAWGVMARQWMSPAAWADGNPFNAPPVTIAVTSKVPVEVTAELRPGAPMHGLVARPLKHTSDAGAPPLVGLEIQCEADRVRLGITVPNDQPGGSYRGEVVDSTGLSQGYVRVDVPPQAAKRSTGKSKKA